MKIFSTKSSLITIAFVCVVLATTGVVALTMPGKQTAVTAVKPGAKIQNKVIDTAIVYNSTLLKKVTELANNLNALKNLTINGYITINNPADTVQNINREAFKFVIKGRESYYKIGAAELLNTDSVNVFINHEQKSIVLSTQKTPNVPVAIDVEKFKNRLQFGDYQLLSKTAGKSKIISIINEGNLDCKEYAITYDTLSTQIKRIYTRTGDIDKPFDRQSDKVFDIVITSITNQAVIHKKMIYGEVLYKKNNRWLLSDSYLNYSLIQH